MNERSRGQLPRGILTKLALLFAATALLPHVVSQWVSLSLIREAWASWLLPLAFTIIAFSLGWLIERSVARELSRLRRAVRRVGRGDFTCDLTSRGTSWDGLASEINQAAISLDGWRVEYEDRLTAKESELGRMRAEAGRLSQSNMQLQAEGLQHDKSFASLEEFVIAINRLGDPAQIAGQLLTYIDSEFDYSIASVLLVEAETLRLVPVAIGNREKGTRLVGNYVKDIQSLQPIGAKSAIGRAISAGRSMLINDVEDDRRGLVTRPEVQSELAVPLKLQDKSIGVVHLESSRRGAYTMQQEARLALLANATATAIGNVRLFEEEAKVRMLREMDSLKSQLISTVSHELRTPLAAIKGYSTSLQRPEGKLDEATRHEFLQIIEEEADRLSEMIENLLDLSKIEAGVLHIHHQPVQLERIVRKVIERARRRATQFRFRVRFASDFPIVPGAAHRLEQVIHNLVENAVKYSPEEGGRITISGDVEEEQVIVSVTDEGMGIPIEHRERVFEPFYQVDSSTARRVGGSGLGLAICRGFVAAHGGRIWVDGEPGQGSIFRFSLPRHVAENMLDVESESVHSTVGG